MERLKEECGIVAVYQMGCDPANPDGWRNVYPYVVRGLLELQNRGQLSAGLTSYNPSRNRILQTHKDLGTVHEVFHLHNPRKSQHLMEEYAAPHGAPLHKEFLRIERYASDCSSPSASAVSASSSASAVSVSAAFRRHLP